MMLSNAEAESNDNTIVAINEAPSAIKLTLSHEGEHHGDFGETPVQITTATYLFVMCAAVNSCNLGYDIGVSTGAGRLIQQEFDLTLTQREIFVASINFWAMFGALIAQYCSDKYGRRVTFIVAALGFIIGLVVMASAQVFDLLLFGRFLVGLGVGTGLAIDPLYIAEVTPAKHRGELVTWSEIALNVGIVLGFTTDLVLGSLPDSTEWRVMFLLGAILPIIMIFLALKVMPESPRWLVSKGKDDEAKEVLTRIYPIGFDVDLVVGDIREALERERAAEEAVGWSVIFHPTLAFRRMLLVGIGTAVSQQAVGIDAIQYYLLDLIEESGIDSNLKRNLVLILLGLLKLVFIVVGGKLFDRKGRRPLFAASLLGMAAALLMVATAFFIDSTLSTGFIIVGTGVYLSFFSIGMGPGAWLIPSEVFATCIRAKAMSVATFANRVTATVMAATFPSVANAIGWGGCFLMLFVICLIVFTFLHFFLPETKGRSLEDMSVYFAEITGDRSVLEAEDRLRRAVMLPSQTNHIWKTNIDVENDGII